MTKPSITPSARSALKVYAALIAGLLLGLVGLVKLLMETVGTDAAPRIQCIRSTDLAYGMIMTDSMIATAYLAIPVALLMASHQRPDLFRNWRVLLRLFAAFIVSCSMTHSTGILLMWWPSYQAALVVNSICAALSIGTAYYVLIGYPTVLTQIPNVDDLIAANEALIVELDRMRSVRLAPLHERMQALSESVDSLEHVSKTITAALNPRGKGENSGA